MVIFELESLVARLGGSGVGAAFADEVSGDVTSESSVWWILSKYIIIRMRNDIEINVLRAKQ